MRYSQTYSILLYMASPIRTRMTFRLGPDLAGALRQLPNQTAFVEGALRDALGRLCPLCHGTGEANAVHLTVSDFKVRPIPRLNRSAAVELKALVRLGRQLLATELELEPGGREGELDFRLAREDQLLLYGRIPGEKSGAAEIKLAH